MAGVAAPKRKFGGSGHGTIRPVTVEVIFQRCPGTAAALGIDGLKYELKVGKNSQRSTTGADGKVGTVTVSMIPGTTANLMVMGTEYQLSACGALEAVNTVLGIQRRLHMLGYYVGNVDGAVGEKTEYAVLNFQADNAPLRVDGLAGPQTRQQIKTVVGE